MLADEDEPEDAIQKHCETEIEELRKNIHEFLNSQYVISELDRYVVDSQKLRQQAVKEMKRFAA